MKLKSVKNTYATVETYEAGHGLEIVKTYVGKLSAANDMCQRALASISTKGKGPHGSYPMLIEPDFDRLMLSYPPFHSRREIGRVRNDKYWNFCQALRKLTYNYDTDAGPLKGLFFGMDVSEYVEYVAHES